MGLKIRFCLIIIFILSIAPIVEAAWEGPVEVISGVWGSGTGQFGLRTGGSEDAFPLLNVVTPDGKIVITDSVNKKQLVFSVQSNFIKDIQWIVKSREGGRTVYDVPEYSFGPVVGFSADGNIFTSSGGKYFLVSSTGQFIKTLATKPLELGVVKGNIPVDGGYRHIIEYPGQTYNFVIPFRVLNRFQRDLQGNMQVAAQSSTTDAVYRISKCGRITGEMLMPENVFGESERIGIEDFKTYLEEYGNALFGPDGNIYTWKRTPDKYSILKWTWVDDSNDPPSGPDAPTGLTLMPSTTGIYLTWTASAQDPGCVTGYEVARATSAVGATTTVATVNAGVMKYNDSTASAGTMYYYKIRAKAGSEYSLYTGEVSGKR